jgi:hypothetical protein
LYQYKTIVTDYEGMQDALSVYGAQGWRLASVTPDTHRIVSGKPGVDVGLSLNPSSDSSHREISASYYLLVFERQGEPLVGIASEAASASLDYPEFSLPDY